MIDLVTPYTWTEVAVEVAGLVLGGVLVKVGSKTFARVDGKLYAVNKTSDGVYTLATNAGVFRTTDAVSVTGARSIDKAQSYETGVREIYGGASLSDRVFTVIVDGRRVNGIADDVAVINGRTTAVDAKFTDNWATSIRNSNSPNGNQPWAIAEQQKMVDQARNYSEAFDGGAIYHTSNQALAQHYTKVFNDAGISNFEFVITPTR